MKVAMRSPQPAHETLHSQWQAKYAITNYAFSVPSLLDYVDQTAASEGHHKSLIKLWNIKKASNILTEVTNTSFDRYLKDFYVLKYLPYKTKCFPSFWRVTVTTFNVLEHSAIVFLKSVLWLQDFFIASGLSSLFQ